MTFSSESEEDKNKVNTTSIYFPPVILSIQVKPDDQDEPKCNKNYKCDEAGCKAKFSRPWRLQAHKAAKHSGEKPFACDVKGCEKKYTSSSHLRRHKATAHVLNSAPKSLFKCLQCAVQLKTKEILKKHFRRAHMPKPFVCPMCPQTFSKHILLKRHAYIHTGIPPLSCSECGLGFTRKGELNKHIRGSHRIHICPKKNCLETFKAWSLLRKHLSKHLSSHTVDYRFECYYCNKAFKNRYTIRRHIKDIHDPYGLKPDKKHKQSFTCAICNYVFKHKASLKRHINLIHEGKSVKRERKAVRAKRKDAGTHWQSLACRLSGVELPREIQAKIVREEITGILHPSGGLNINQDEIIVEHDCAETKIVFPTDQEEGQELLSDNSSLRKMVENLCS